MGGGRERERWKSWVGAIFWGMVKRMQKKRRRKKKKPLEILPYSKINLIISNYSAWREPVWPSGKALGW